MKPYFDEDGITIYHADMRDAVDFSPVACVVTSPPYNSGVGYDEYKDFVSPEDYRLLALSAAALIFRSTVAVNGRSWVNIGVRQFGPWYAALAEVGLQEQAIVAWDYGLATSGTAWGSWQSPSAPHLRFAWEPVIVSTPSPEWARIPPEGSVAYRDTSPDWPLLCRNLWEIQPGASTAGHISGHPAVMPRMLANRAIRLSTWPGETVLDPFMGSGTTLVEAKQLGRKAIGIELSEAYCEIAAHRCRQGVFDFASEAAV